MTDASTQSDERVEEAPNQLQTPDECRILTDGGEAQTAEQEEEESGDEGSDAASNGQSESTDESTDEESADEESADEESADEESTDEAETEEDEEGAESEGEEPAEAESGAEAEDESEDYEEDEGTTVLFLDLEGLFLDLLGLEVDLNEVVLDVSAVSGPGKLLGNLLDAVSGLLGSGDSGLLMDLVGGSLFEGIMPDEDGEGGLLGDFLSSGEGGEGEDGEGDEEDSESRVSEAAGSVKESLSEAFGDVPFDEILTSVLKELVEQMFEDSDDGGESGSGSEA
jgi:hypothetical protein